MTSVLDVERLSKTFGRVTALDDVAFSVQEGEVLGLIGPKVGGQARAQCKVDVRGRYG